MLYGRKWKEFVFYVFFPPSERASTEERGVSTETRDVAKSVLRTRVLDV